MLSAFKSHVTKPEGGFTITELIVVLGIIGIGLVIAIPAYNVTIKPTADLNGAARQIFSDIQLTKLRAVSENVNYGLDFAAGPSYIVFIDNNGDSQRNGGDQDIKTVNLKADYTTVELDTAKDGISFTNDAFAMTSRGLPTGAGSVFLTNSKGEEREISVNIMGGAGIKKS
ncbi:MAG: GspH/FimT family pseudopilin [Deltaproteobacteria bacterium]|nr:GspH/FimT family pseudopilin [Deltaproteobacteria bacterium]